MLNLYFWETIVKEKAELMTAAFGCKLGVFGLSFIVVDNKKQAELDKKKLIHTVTDTMDIVLHHGDQILDSDGSIHTDRLQDAEARRHYLDPNWKQELYTFHATLKVKEVSEKQAKLLKLL